MSKQGIPLHLVSRNYGALDVLSREVWTISCIVETIIWMAGRIIIGGRLNLTVSFISSLSSLGCLLHPYPSSPPSHPSPRPTPALSLSLLLAFPPSIWILCRITHHYHNCAITDNICDSASKLYLDALNPFSIWTAGFRWTRSRKFRCVISAPLSVSLRYGIMCFAYGRCNTDCQRGERTFDGVSWQRVD